MQCSKQGRRFWKFVANSKEMDFNFEDLLESEFWLCSQLQTSASFTDVITNLSITDFCQHYRLITQGGATQLLDFPREESNSKRVNYAKHFQTILRRWSWRSKGPFSGSKTRPTWPEVGGEEKSSISLPVVTGTALAVFYWQTFSPWMPWNNYLAHWSVHSLGLTG